QATFTAQLLYPDIADYEVMPWPDRIYEGLYKSCADCETKERIPRFYSTQMQVMVNTLNDMPLSDNRVNGSQGIGVLMSNSLMFQRFPTHKGYEDPQFSNFYGQTLPLLKRGIPVSTVHIENTPYADTWKELKVLVMSYSNMKPMKPDYHEYIAKWVKGGGTLIYCGKDVDPYQTTMEWWNSDGKSYQAPSMHLFEALGLASASPETGEYVCGKGHVYVLREEPKVFVLEESNDGAYFELVSKAFAAANKGVSLELKNNLYLERGPYIITAVMDESVSAEPLTLNGLYIDLFDPELPVLTSKVILPDRQAFLYDLSKVADKSKPAVLCGASRIYDEIRSGSSYSFVAKSPAQTNNVSRVYLPRQPKSIKLPEQSTSVWDEASHTVLLKFENNPDGVKVNILF
ncbi:MAG: hypothetical protein LBS80_04175, partial [Tannerella sp.]|nr:hypothetical protein [Tannerella sp.]